MLLSDARLPTAGHTQSGGLEPALANGLDPSRLVDFCRARLATVTLTEAATAVVSRHRALCGHGTEDVELAWAARTPSNAMRATSRTMGRAYRRLALSLWPGNTVLGELEVITHPCRARVLGLVAAAGALSAPQVVRLVGYDDVQTVVSASLKLSPGDPIEAARWVLGLREAIESMVPQCADLIDPQAIPAASSPAIEAWAQAHANTTRRLFSA
jgi:urease accessory protein